MNGVHGPARAEQADSTRRITRVTRRDIFDVLRAAEGPWHGRLDEIEFLEGLYDLSALPSTDSRPEYPTAREDIGQHRLNNDDWQDDWILEDPRFDLLDGPDEILLRFLARMVHPEVQPDTDLAARQVDALNRLLGPDGWRLRASEFLSGRPIYTPIPVTSASGPTIPLPLRDDDASKLDLVLGQAHRLLDLDGQDQACDLLRDATLSLRRDGGQYRPTPWQNWSDTFEAVLTVDAALASEFTTDMISLIWKRLGPILGRHERGDVQSLAIAPALLPPPEAAEDWRHAASPAPSNHARREKAAEKTYPTEDDLVFASRAELAVYQVLKELQRERPVQHTIAIAPLPSVKLRDAGVRSPDFLVIGNGRAVVIEIDGRHHYGTTRKADDADRDRHWARCNVDTISITAEYTDNRAELAARLREEFTRHLLQRR
jgi:AbiJ N-terminal domain 3